MVKGWDNRRNLAWRGDRVYRSGRPSGIGIVQDAKYPTMWRVKFADGHLSDMVNRTRAKDAAERAALQYNIPDKNAAE